MKIRKLTPAVLKKIIAEEKRKLSVDQKKQSTSSRKTNLIERKVDHLTKLALLEAKQKNIIKKIKRARELIKKSLK